MKINWGIIYCLFYLFIFIPHSINCAEDTSSKPIKIGIYDNPPKLFVDEKKVPKGIFPGIVKHIAKNEGWEVQFIPLSFKDGLKKLENGTLDIMQDVAWSKKRSKLYSFTNETVMVSWGRVYKRTGLEIETFIDLKNKRIAFMDGGIYSEGPDGLINLMEKFELNAHFIPVNGYKEVFELIDKGKADAGIVNRLYGKLNSNEYAVEKTPLLISPISIRFAFDKNNHITPYLISKIDSHLVRLKKDGNSIYYKLLDQYIRDPEVETLPKDFKTLLLVLLILSVFFGAIGVISRLQVKKKTTLLRLREEALAKSEAKFRRIFENLQDVYFETSLSRKILNVSPSAEGISKYPPEELIGSPVDMIYFDPADRESLINTIKTQKKVRDFEVLLKKKTGETFYASLNADLYFDKNSQPYGMTGTLRDITRRKEYETKIKKREERFREMARLLPCGIVETDADFNILYANQTGLDMFGYDIEDLKENVNGNDLLHPDEYKKAADRLNKQKQGMKVPPIEYRMVKKDGSDINVLWNSVPIFHRNTIIGHRGSISDLTELKRLQNEVIRTQKLESTGILAGGIAHDFNNILLGLLGNISLAKNELSPDENAYTLIQEAEKSLARANDLTNQLLTFAKGGDPIKSAITIDEIIKETAKFNLSGSNIKIIMENQEDLWQINADKGQISQVISNLIINARQAMPSGGQIKIKMENTAFSENEFSALNLDKYVKISISDQGIGIPNDHLEKIFDPYFTTKQKGSGLGLSIVHSIIIKHNGSIFVTSDMNKGTTFTFYLPATSSIQEEATQESAEQISTQDIPMKPAKILLMDDDLLVRQVGEKMLTILGHSVELSVDGMDALEKYRLAIDQKVPFDAVIMDLTVPGGMGGLDSVKKILKINPEARVIVASGYSNDPVLSNFKEHGFVGVVTKPYTIEEIKKVIKDAL